MTVLRPGGTLLESPAYDEAGKLIKSLDGMGGENFYDGEDLQAGLRERGKRKAFLFEDGEITAELDESGRAASLYLRGYGAEAVERGGERHAIHRDERSGTAYLTGSGGAVENAYDYDAFGLPLSRLEGIENRLLYAGQQYDPETGRYYLRSRYYDPSIGRFTQEDANRGDGLNLYAYCENNPVSYYDPSGLCADANDGNIQKNAKRGNVTVSEGGSGSAEAQIPRTGDVWHKYFNETYGKSNVTWESANINDIVDMPSKIVDFTPQQVAELAKTYGWSVEPLGKGSMAGVPFDQGGGFSMHAPNGGSEYIQYHPGGGHHGADAYYKISSGPNGTVRYNLNGGKI